MKNITIIQKLFSLSFLDPNSYFTIRITKIKLVFLIFLLFEMKDLESQCAGQFFGLREIYCEADCEGNANLCMRLDAPGEFYVRFTYNNQLLTYFNSSIFHEFLVQGDQTSFESIVPIGECNPHKSNTYCISGLFKNYPIIEGSIQVHFFDFANHSIHYGTFEVKINKIRTVSGTANLKALIANQTLLDGNSAKIEHQNIILDQEATLEIDEDYYFNEGPSNGRGRTHIMPLANSKIKVLSGFKLVINGAFLGGCNPWKGIELMPDAILEVNPNSSNETVIDWADNGILMHEGSKVVLKKAHFKRNLIGIHAPAEPNPFTRDLTITGSIFDGMNRPNSQGMLIYNMPYTLIYSYTLLASPRVTFTGLTNGVVSYNSNLDFYVPIFKNITNVGVQAYDYNGDMSNSKLKIDNLIRPSGKHSDKNFDKMKTAIYASNTELNVLGANIQDVQQGVTFSSESGRNASIVDCDIKAKRTCVTINGRNGSEGEIVNNSLINNPQSPLISSNTLTFNSIFGINNGPWNVERNIIQNNGFGRSLQAQNFFNLNLHDNIRITKTSNLHDNIEFLGGSKNKITCNPIISGGKYGININNSNGLFVKCNANVNSNQSALVINNLCENSEIKGNAFNSQSSFAMQYATSPYLYTVTGDQEYNGNCFLGLGSNDKSVKHGYQDEEVVRKSQYLVEEISHDCHDPLEEAITNDWIFEDNGQNFSCPSGLCLPGLRGPGDESFNEDIITNNLGSSTFINEINYTLKNHLYQDLIESGNIPSQFQSFVNVMSQSSSVELNNIIKTLSSSLKYLPSELADLESYNSTLSNLKESLQAYFNTTNPNVSNPNNWLSDVTAIQDQINTIELQIREIEESRSLRNQLAITNCINQLQLFSPQNSIELNTKDLMLIYLPQMLNSELELNESEESLIFNIANQCVLKGGDVVIQARAILGIMGNNTEFNDELLCAPAILPLTAKSDKSKTELLISENDIIIRKLSDDPLFKLSIFSTEGKLLMVKILHGSNLSNHDIRLPQEINSGLYLIQVELVSGKIETYKLFKK